MKILRMMLLAAVFLTLSVAPVAARHKHSKKCYRKGGHAYVVVTFQFGRAYRDRDHRYRRNRRDYFYDRRDRYYDRRYGRRNYRRSRNYCPRY